MNAKKNVWKVLALPLLAWALLPAVGGLSQGWNMAEGNQVKGPWADAEVGTFIKFKITTETGQKIRTIEVVQADERCVTLRSTEGGKSCDRPEPRMYTRQELDKWLAGKKLDDQTIVVMGKEMRCEVYEKEITMAGKKVKARAYFNRLTPGWLVRVENDSDGQFKTVLELTEFKR